MGNQLSEIIRNNMTALIVEAVETLDEVPWKPWAKNSKQIDKEALKAEIADCLLFVFNAAYEVGLDAEDLAIVAASKQAKNLKRFDHVRPEE